LKRFRFSYDAVQEAPYSSRQKVRAFILMAIWFLPVLPTPGSAQDAPQTSQDDPDTSLTEAQWRKRVEDARARAEEFVANARARMADPLQSDKEDAKAAGSTSIERPSLKPGDIVSTSTGLLRLRMTGGCRTRTA
jgi:hypothetical protein